MKAVFSSNGFKSISLKPQISRVLGVFFYTTKTPISTTNNKKDSLFSRISSSAATPSSSVGSVIDQWIREGKAVNKNELDVLIRTLRHMKKFERALEIFNWMNDKSYFVLAPREVAVRLDLISKIHGIEQAEMYFNTIPKQSQVFSVYLALLNCYADKKSIEKAESLMQQMRELGFVVTSRAYNALLNLYAKVGQHDKIDSTMEEMEEKGVSADRYTYSIRLSAYAAASDIDEMGKILQIMEENPEFSMDWNSYATAANGYIQAGSIDKALEMLKKSEKLITKKKWKFAYDSLLALYAGTGRKDEVYRIWNQYKSSEKVYNTVYRCMIESLLKLDDIKGAEKILEEWESGNPSYDLQVPNLLITAYCRNGLLEKAETLVNKAIGKGKKPFASTWEILAIAYVESDQLHKAVEAIKSGFLARRAGWIPNRDTLAACLVYLKQRSDVVKAEEFVRLLGAPAHISIDDSERLLDYIYSYDREAESGKQNDMDADGLDDNEESDEACG